jgi:hypothetical protein
LKITTAYAFIWISCSAAISTAIVVTGELAPLWALLIPAMMRIENDKETK